MTHSFRRGPQRPRTPGATPPARPASPAPPAPAGTLARSELSRLVAQMID